MGGGKHLVARKAVWNEGRVNQLVIACTPLWVSCRIRAIAEPPPTPHPPETMFGGGRMFSLKGFHGSIGVWGCPYRRSAAVFLRKEFMVNPSKGRFYRMERNPSERPIISVMCASGGRGEAVRSVFLRCRAGDAEHM